MADKKRLGRQTPTSEFTLLETNNDITAADETIQIYETEKRHAMEWQMYLIRNIMAKDADGLWIHSKVGYSIPRRNGKGEILVMRELYGLLNGEKILHTAHRTTTSHSAAVRLVKELDDRGYIEIQRPDKTKKYEKSYTFSKQFGLERIHIYDGDKGGQIDFRTRSGKGGLGEGFDLLIVDEAQEYQDDHESALKYVVTDSANPQTIMCGTPPTAVSSGTVFTKFRNDCLSGKGNHSYWAEWSVEEEHEFDDREAWYETNPSLGLVLTERKIEDEAQGDKQDFNIQRLGLWIRYNQHSAITEKQWKSLQVSSANLKGKVAIGIKCGKQINNVSIAVACKTNDDRVFTEVINSKPLAEGVEWITAFIKRMKSEPLKIVFDGAQAQTIIQDAFKDAGIKGLHLPTVMEYIDANAKWEIAIMQKSVIHSEQPQIAEAVTNCEKRAIGSHGGFGYNSTKSNTDIGLMDAMILAHWAVLTFKEKKKQQITY